MLLRAVLLDVAMLVAVAQLTDVPLDALLVSLAAVRDVVPLNVALLDVTMPLPVALLADALHDALLV